MSRNIAIIDTTILPGLVALLGTSECATHLEIKQFHLSTTKQGTVANLAAYYQSILNAAGGPIDTLLLSVGPGSFTGIKLGIGFAKGLVAGRGAEFKVLPFSSLAALAQNEFGDEGSGAIFLRATANKGYFAHWSGLAGTIECGLVDIAGARVSLRAHGRGLVGIPLENYEFGEISVAGDWPELIERATKSIDKTLRVIAIDQVAEKILNGVISSHENLLGQDLVEYLNPLYLRLSSPEERVKIQELEAAQCVTN